MAGSCAAYSSKTTLVAGSCAAYSNKTTPVAGSCAAYSNGKREASGDRRGNPKLACPPSRSTVAFELLRRRRSWRPCPPVWRRHSEQSSKTPTLRQQHRRNGEPSSGYAPSETAEGTDVWPPPSDCERFCKYLPATCYLDRLQHFQEYPEAWRLTNAVPQWKLHRGECAAAAHSSRNLPTQGLPMVSGRSQHLSFCGSYRVSITSMEESVNLASLYPYHSARLELFTIRNIALKSS